MCDTNNSSPAITENQGRTQVLTNASPAKCLPFASGWSSVQRFGCHYAPEPGGLPRARRACVHVIEPPGSSIRVALTGPFEKVALDLDELGVVVHMFDHTHLTCILRPSGCPRRGTASDPRRADTMHWLSMQDRSCVRQRPIQVTNAPHQRYCLRVAPQARPLVNTRTG